MDPLLALHHRLLPPLLGVGRCVRQALKILLRTLTLEKDNPMSEALCLLKSRGQHYGALRLHY
jgi:hypothetical protein